MKRLKIAALAAVMYGAGYMSARAGDTYQPTFYPSAPDFVVYDRGPTFRTLDGARAWVKRKRKEHEQARELAEQYGERYEEGVGFVRILSAEPDYEIGVNCRPFGGEGTGSDLAFCDETVR